jgi:serine/threonine protein kinase/tetratricopeptide (TPR) repeat protein
MHERSIFMGALEFDEPVERSAYILRACGGDECLRARIEALLRWHSTKGGLAIDVVAAAEPSLAEGMTRTLEGLGTWIGPYKLIDTIGEGGMGMVYVAEQSQPVRRKVALKVIRPGMDTSQVVARFEAERQALALMDHPNIAKVLDAGTTEFGRPYFVMELVQGISITRYCDEARLSPRGRLELFVPVCRAIQHAHQKGIVHRDIKPSNVLITLVDGQPVPKVIDFGVAKAIDQRLTERTLFTGFGAVLGTPEYMSPEQAEIGGQDVDTRSDVYALGILLYELLTGTTPLDRETLPQAALAEVLRRIREEEPPRPSTRLSGSGDRLSSLAVARDTEAAKLACSLRGDLDWIVMKALEKDRDRRYDTANELARDVRRYLDGDPVEAGPPSTAYRLRRYARKHRTVFAMAATIAAVLLVATAVTTWQAVVARRAAAAARHERAVSLSAEARAIRERNAASMARRRAESAEEATRRELTRSELMNRFLTEDLLSQAEPANNAVEDRVTLLEVLDRAAEKVGRRFAGQPELECELRRVIARAYHGLGAWEKAERQRRAAHDSATRRLGPDSVEALQDSSELAHILRHQGRLGEAIVLCRSALDRLTLVLGPDHVGTLACRGHLASIYRDAGRTDEAIALLQETLAGQAAALGPEHPDTLASRGNLASAYRSAGRTSEAIELIAETSKSLAATLGPAHPDTLTSRNNLASAYLAAGRTAEAIALLKETITRQTATLGPEHSDTLTTRGNLAAAYAKAGLMAEAIVLAREVITRQAATLGAAHPDTLTSRNNLAAYCQSLGRTTEAIALLKETIELQAATLGPAHPDTLTSRNNLASAYLAAGRTAEAIALLKETITRRESSLGSDHPDTLTSRSNLAVAYLRLGRTAESMDLLEETIALQKARLGPEHPDTLVSRSNLAMAYGKAGRADESIALMEELLPRFEARLGPEHPHTLTVRNNLAISYQDRGRWDQAERLLRKLLNRQRAVTSPGSPELAAALAQLATALLHERKWSEAETALRECLTIREARSPDDWSTFGTMSLLGGALLSQGRYADAEHMLVNGYQGLRARGRQLPPGNKPGLREAGERVVALYEAWGKPGLAAAWRAELSEASTELPANVFAGP